ncbi:MAG TPA: hypothetical protein PLV41_07160 [Miltoncostaeales bacterium]|nr:hypothetical protein [Miltoncostaeales bacterium]
MTSPDAAVRSGSKWRIAAALLLAATVAQLAVATFVPNLEQFAGKAFLSRLIAYPVMMLIAPTAWWLVTRRRSPSSAMPWAAVALIMVPFLIDVTGNTLDLYDTVWWWDDANHFVNWAFLSAGVGVMIARDQRARGWLLVLAVTGVGAIMAILWEIGEYYAFIRGGTELAGAYTDTLGDEVLGTLGGLVGALILAWTLRTPRPRTTSTAI